MLKRGCAIEADTRSSIAETFAIGSAGSSAATIGRTAAGDLIGGKIGGDDDLHFRDRELVVRDEDL